MIRNLKKLDETSNSSGFAVQTHRRKPTETVLGEAEESRGKPGKGIGARGDGQEQGF